MEFILLLARIIAIFSNFTSFRFACIFCFQKFKGFSMVLNSAMKGLSHRR